MVPGQKKNQTAKGGELATNVAFNLKPHPSSLRLIAQRLLKYQYRDLRNRRERHSLLAFALHAMVCLLCSFPTLA